MHFASRHCAHFFEEETAAGSVSGRRGSCLTSTGSTKTQLLLAASRVMAKTLQRPSAPVGQACWDESPAAAAKHRVTGGSGRLYQWQWEPVWQVVVYGTQLWESVQGAIGGWEHTHFAHLLSPALWGLLSDKDQYFRIVQWSTLLNREHRWGRCGP